MCSVCALLLQRIFAASEILCMCVCVYVCMCVCVYVCMCVCVCVPDKGDCSYDVWYGGVATISRLLQIIGLFCRI